MSTLRRILWISVMLNCCFFAYSQQKPFVVNISTPKTTVTSGAPLPLNITLKNISDHTIWVPINSADVGIGRTFEITACDSSGKKVPNIAEARPMAGEKHQPQTFTGGILPVDPGKEISRKIDLESIFDLSRAGTYTIQVRKVEQQTKTIQESNILTITVIPNKP